MIRLLLWPGIRFMMQLGLTKKVVIVVLICMIPALLLAAMKLKELSNQYQIYQANPLEDSRVTDFQNLISLLEIIEKLKLAQISKENSDLSSQSISNSDLHYRKLFETHYERVLTNLTSVEMGNLLKDWNQNYFLKYNRSNNTDSLSENQSYDATDMESVHIVSVVSHYYDLLYDLLNDEGIKQVLSNRESLMHLSTVLYIAQLKTVHDITSNHWTDNASVLTDNTSQTLIMDQSPLLKLSQNILNDKEDLNISSDNHEVSRYIEYQMIADARRLDHFLNPSKVLATGSPSATLTDAQYFSAVNEVQKLINKFGEIQRKDNDSARVFSDQLENFYAAYIESFSIINDEIVTRLIKDTQRQQSVNATNIKSITITLGAISLGLLVLIYTCASFILSSKDSLDRFVKGASRFSEGDLNTSIEVNSLHDIEDDELGKLAHKLNLMMSRMRTTVIAMQRTAESVNDHVRLFETVAVRSQAAVDHQLEHTNAISQTLENVAESAGTITSLAKDAERAASDGHSNSDQASNVVSRVMEDIQKLSDEISKSMTTVNHLSENSLSISSILETIKNIAEQTNLLALNAAIEAARAGEQGRGFAVVADEVRTLASRTQGSAQEIEQLIIEVQKNISTAVSNMESNRDMVKTTVEDSNLVGLTLSDIQKSMLDIQHKTEHISLTAGEQQQAADRLHDNIESIRIQGRESHNDAVETVKEAKEAQSIANQLQTHLKEFKVR